MAYPVRDFLPSRRLVMAGAAATFISAATARAEISSGLIKGAMKRFKLTTPPKPVPDLEFLDVDDQPMRLSDLNGQGATDQPLGDLVCALREGNAEPRPAAGRDAARTGSW